MSKKTKKWYVVWEWRETGIFDNWEDCKNSVNWYFNAKFKSFSSLQEAEDAFQKNCQEFIWLDTWQKYWLKNFLSQTKETDCIFVDAACSSNPWILEWRWVDKDWNTIFKQWPYQNGTVNIGEFLAICQWLWFLQKNWKQKTKIYSDSKTAISRIKNKKVNTKLKENSENKILFELLKRAEDFLKNNIFENEIIKRDTKKFGEIPADFGRK